LAVDNSDPDMKMAKVDFAGVVKNICIQWVDDVRVGDYILAHVGTALSKIDETDALETLESLKAMGDL